MILVWDILQGNPDLTYLAPMLNDNDPRSAKDQLHSGYLQNGGWDPFQGFKLTGNNSLKYKGDPPLHPIAKTQLRNEVILLYKSDWVAIIQPDRSFEVSRMD